MKNPWKTIDLNVYEEHMRLSSVGQLQALNEFMRVQLEEAGRGTAMILGVAGGNGLEHISSAAVKKVYAVDINERYLDVCRERYSYLGDAVEYICADVSDGEAVLPRADTVIADLFIEYIGCNAFIRQILKIRPRSVSCVIQLNCGEGFVSQSPYESAFDGLNEIHRDVDENELGEAMKAAGYTLLKRAQKNLPNGKALIMLTYVK